MKTMSDFYAAAIAGLEGDLQAIIDAASPETANSQAVAQMRDLVDEITAALQEE